MAIDDNTTYGLTGAQVKELAGQVNSAKTQTGASAPTTATPADYVGQLFYDTTNDDLYCCSAITAQGTDPETYEYTWETVGGGGGGIPTYEALRSTAQLGSLSTSDYPIGSFFIVTPATGVNNSTLYSSVAGSGGLLGGVKSGSKVLMFRAGVAEFIKFSDGGYNSTSTNATYSSPLVSSVGAHEVPGVSIALSQKTVVNNLTSSLTDYPLSANQGRVLNTNIGTLSNLTTTAKTSAVVAINEVNAKVLTNAGAPTTSTVGTVGQLLADTTNGKLYICTDATNPYVWEEIGAGGGGIQNALIIREWS